MTPPSKSLPGSFRDPSGFLFQRGDRLYRQVNQSYREEYHHLLTSGLYEVLVGEGLLIPHQEVEAEFLDSQAGYLVLEPERIPFLSYPYEWCFSQLKAAALTTLEIADIALNHGMILKDASAYNIQFRGTSPVFIDTLSFERWRGNPWDGYRQYCQHFLAPLALMAQRDLRLGKMLRVHLDGIPLDLASRLLPFRSRLSPGLLMHLHLHAGAQRRAGSASGKGLVAGRGVAETGLRGLFSSLQSITERLSAGRPETEWVDYDQMGSYSEQALGAKQGLVAEFISQVDPEWVWDLGANRGRMSRLAVEQGANVVASDIDPGAVERMYREVREAGIEGLYPLVMDLTDPSPSLGWDLKERESFLRRGPVDLVMALALVHHLAIGNNVPFPALASFFAGLGRWLLVEFVPKHDKQVERMLATRRDIFETYGIETFTGVFEERFDIVERREIPDSHRTLFLMKRR